MVIGCLGMKSMASAKESILTIFSMAFALDFEGFSTEFGRFWGQSGFLLSPWISLALPGSPLAWKSKAAYYRRLAISEAKTRIIESSIDTARTVF